MYGTIFRMEVKSGQEQKLVDIFREWDSQVKPKVEGVIGSYLLKSDKDPRKYMGVAVFKDKSSYVANTDNPEQDQWYRKLREVLESDPEWEDGEYVLSGDRA